MKIKYLAASLAALGSSPTFAVVYCDDTNAVTFTNTCAPDAVLFIAGSSTVGNALARIIPPELFDTSVTSVIQIQDKSTGADSQAATTKAWYGMSLPSVTGGTSRRLFVVYNNNNGSAAGVSVMLSKFGTFPESKVVTVGPDKITPNTCVADASSTFGAPVVNCTRILARPVDIAISNVNPRELSKVYAGVDLGTTGKPTYVAQLLFMQGFGIAVNDNLYQKLQAMQIASGELPGACAAGAYSLACQPNIKSAQYAALVSRDGSIKTAAALVGDAADTTKLTLARRNDLSGTQAASNLMFAHNGCGGIGYNAATRTFNWDNATKRVSKANFAVLGGGLDIAGAADSVAGQFVVTEGATSDAVKHALDSTDGYVIGALGLGSPGSHRYKFVKLDGVSPDFKLDGSMDMRYRDAMINGRYAFQAASFAVTPLKPVGSAKTYPALVSAVFWGLKDSTLHDLTAVGYLDGGNNPAKASRVWRTAGNNCSPLIRYNLY